MAETLFNIEPREVKPYNKKKGVSKPVLQIKNGVVINRFDSISEAGRKTNILSNCISDVCRGVNKTTGGFGWKYADFDMPEASKKKRIKSGGITAIKKVKKGPFKIVITELCKTEDDAKALLDSFIGGTRRINPKSAKIIQARSKK